MHHKPTLVIMAKRAQAGRVKTRLAGDVGAIEALRLYRRLLWFAGRRLADDRRWQTLLALTPETNGARPRLSGCRWIGQGRGDLGARLQRVFDTVGRGPLIVVGADIPGMQANLIARAFRVLQGHDAVFGPAEDGGYWLVGLSRRRCRLAPFGGVRWSSADALADTLANLDGVRIGRIDRLRDLDTGADLAACGGSMTLVPVPDSREFVQGAPGGVTGSRRS